MPPDATLPPVTISGLPKANQANVTDQFEVNQFGTTRSLLLGQVAALMATLNPPPAPVTINVTPPSSPSPGELWWSSDLGQLFIWYDDGNSAQWVQALPTDLVSSLRLTPVLVSALGPATAGRLAYVSNGTASLAWGAVVTGGGATPYLVSANGTAWTVAGK